MLYITSLGQLDKNVLREVILMLPKLNIPIAECNILLNLNVCIVTTILVSIYRKYTKYILKAYKISDTMIYQQNFYRTVINTCSIILIIVGAILAISVDNSV